MSGTPEEATMDTGTSTTKGTTEDMAQDTAEQAAQTGDLPEGMTTVPELVGLPAADAHDRALDAGVLAVGRNAVHTGAGRGHVEDQEPAAGEQRERGAEVGIWIQGGAARTATGPDPDDGQDGSGGGGGVRPEPSPVGPAGGGTG
ncbi:PASTA domain-containing protein [Actinomycetospora lutea]|uniref:PASTA domain-containing protein n=1 Tax=Actinomycetospora lutea TaxID=663604 RepID=UPI0023660E02|nr:PASTA domain-containing protein [Actinomycetospora lutea]MDD7936893.1 PASTA domain-containing protein [Actinomycetospora lutea]